MSKAVSDCPRCGQPVYSDILSAIEDKIKESREVSRLPDVGFLLIGETEARLLAEATCSYRMSRYRASAYGDNPTIFSVPVFEVNRPSFLEVI